MLHRETDRFTRVGVPQPHSGVLAAGGHHKTVWAERHRPYLIFVAGHRAADRLSGVGVPKPYGAIVTCGCDSMAVGTENRVVNPRRVPDQVGTDLSAGLGVPQPQLPVGASGDEPATLRADDGSGAEDGSEDRPRGVDDFERVE